MTDFNWQDNEEAIVIPRQDAIAVYANPDGDVVIRRERDWNEQDDVFIVINRKCVHSVIEAMERTLSESAQQTDR